MTWQIITCQGLNTDIFFGQVQWDSANKMCRDCSVHLKQGSYWSSYWSTPPDWHKDKRCWNLVSHFYDSCDGPDTWVICIQNMPPLQKRKSNKKNVSNVVFVWKTCSKRYQIINEMKMTASSLQPLTFLDRRRTLKMLLRGNCWGVLLGNDPHIQTSRLPL